MSARTVENYVGHWLRSAHQRASALLAEQLRDNGVTPAQLATLLRLQEVGNISQNELGRLVAMEPANIHRITNVLLKQKLVLTAKHPTDGRKTTIRLSGKGQKLVTALEPLHARANLETLEPLNAGERTQLLTLLKKLCRTEGS